MNPKYEVLGDVIEQALIHEDGTQNTTATIDLLTIIAEFVKEEIVTLGEPIRDGMELLKSPIEDLTISILLEQILILSAHSTLKKEFNTGARNQITRQCIWRIEILRNLIKKYRK
jgi:hypothetical protein